MRRSVLLAIVVLASPPPRGAPAPESEGAATDEKTFCANEIEVVDRRRKLFEAQGLSAEEVSRRNERPLAALAECRAKFRLEERRRREQRDDVAEVARRAGANATERDREAARREVRLERLASKRTSSLTADERAELAAGSREEVAATHRALDVAHARDPHFMRTVHSALACYHGDRRDVLKELISSEESLLKLGTGDRQKLYALTSELRQSDAVLRRSSDASRSLPGGLDRCTTPTVALVAHCLGILLQSKGAEPACEPEEIQQYLRFVK
jgi:hypothetical protein